VAQKATLPMVLALLIVALGFTTLLAVQQETSPPLIYGGAYAGMMLGVYGIVRVWLPHADALLIPLVTMLTGMGLLMIYRLTYDVPGVENLAISQVIWILAGSGALLATVMLFKNYHRLMNYKYLLALLAIGMLMLTFTPLGYEVNGARLWVQIGPVNFQPSEFARIGLIIFFAAYLADKRDLMAATSRSFLGIPIPSPKYFGPVLLVWAASLGLLVFEKDLGSSLLFFAVPLLMIYVATGRAAYVILGGLMFAVGCVISFFLFAHVRVRVFAWLDPWDDPDLMGFQILQSLFNIADGGIVGTGLGEGFSQTIPEVHTDFIFSAIAAELGLLGASAILLTFLVFVYRGMKIALISGDDFSKLLAGGLTVMFGLQTLVIIGGVTKAIPLTGITLPFISYGGSSVVGNFILTGLLLVISDRAGKRLAGEERQ
jgi:cell division protein FtsW (lipid II flippase)